MSILHKTLGCLYVDSDGVVQFGFNGLSPQTVTGTAVLVQNVIIRLFTTQGSNGFDGDIGGSLYEIIGNGYVPGQEEALQDDFANAFAFVESQTKEEQDSQTDLLDIEKLSSIEVRAVEYQQATQTWDITVRVNTVGGATSTFILIS
ncbi:MAG: hypothetical protein H8D23_00840 [Candidatus Brocadiales bacterium]|nr:hypothetical protein [Candidatus Brocadiales bacterium]